MIGVTTAYRMAARASAIGTPTRAPAAGIAGQGIGVPAGGTPRRPDAMLSHVTAAGLSKRRGAS